MKTIPQFSQQDKETLLTKTPFALPANPSNKNFTAEQIRRKMYEGYVVLFDYINSLISLINENVGLENTAFETLESYFTDGKANYALKDADGDDIDVSALVHKTNSQYVLYGTRKTNNVTVDTTVGYGTQGGTGTIVQRDVNGNIYVPTTPMGANYATSKSYVDAFGKSLSHSLVGSDSQWTFKIALFDNGGNKIDEETQVFGSATGSYAGLMSASDKTKVDNIASDIATALATAKAYTDDKVARTNLVTVLGEASQSLNGLMSADDKAHLDALYAILGENADADTFVNTINEILEVFNNYPEGTTIVNALALKVSFTDIVDNLTTDSSDLPLSAKQGKELKTQVDTKASTNTTVVDDDIKVTGGFVYHIQKGATEYPVAQQVTVYSNPKVVQSIANLPNDNDGFLYLVLDDGYLYYWVEGTGWTQGSEYTTDLFTMTEVTVEED